MSQNDWQTECEECGEDHEYFFQLQEHRAKVHRTGTNIGEKYRCLICGDHFQTHDKRIRHVYGEHRQEVIEQVLDMVKQKPGKMESFYQRSDADPSSLEDLYKFQLPESRVPIPLQPVFGDQKVVNFDQVKKATVEMEDLKALYSFIEHKAKFYQEEERYSKEEAVTLLRREIQGMIQGVIEGEIPSEVWEKKSKEAHDVNVELGHDTLDSEIVRRIQQSRQEDKFYTLEDLQETMEADSLDEAEENG